MITESDKGRIKTLAEAWEEVQAADAIWMAAPERTPEREAAYQEWRRLFSAYLKLAENEGHKEKLQKTIRDESYIDRLGPGCHH